MRLPLVPEFRGEKLPVYVPARKHTTAPAVALVIAFCSSLEFETYCVQLAAAWTSSGLGGSTGYSMTTIMRMRSAAPRGERRFKVKKVNIEKTEIHPSIRMK